MTLTVVHDEVDVISESLLFLVAHHNASSTRPDDIVPVIYKICFGADNDDWDSGGIVR